VAVSLRGAAIWNDAAFLGDYSVLDLLSYAKKKATPTSLSCQYRHTTLAQRSMGEALLLWLLGIPIPIIILLPLTSWPRT
jgi:hypothetical protein